MIISSTRIICGPHIHIRIFDEHKEFLIYHQSVFEGTFSLKPTVHLFFVALHFTFCISLFFASFPVALFSFPPHLYCALPLSILLSLFHIYLHPPHFYHLSLLTCTQYTRCHDIINKFARTNTTLFVLRCSDISSSGIIGFIKF